MECYQRQEHFLMTKESFHQRDNPTHGDSCPDAPSQKNILASCGECGQWVDSRSVPIGPAPAAENCLTPSHLSWGNPHAEWGSYRDSASLPHTGSCDGQHPLLRAPLVVKPIISAKSQALLHKSGTFMQQKAWSHSGSLGLCVETLWVGFARDLSAFGTPSSSDVPGR